MLPVEFEAWFSSVESRLTNAAIRITSTEGRLASAEARLLKLETPVAAPPVFRLYALDSFWNKKLTSEAISPNSNGFVTEILDNNKLAGPWINTKNYSIPVYYVDASTPRVKVFLVDLYAKNGPVDLECQKGVPIPAGVVAANGTDGHLTIIDKSANSGKGREYDFWQMKFNNSRWEATNAGILDNVVDSDGRMVKRSDGYWNSSTATHLPAAGGLMLIDELAKGVMPHALALAIVRPKQSTVVWPAQTTDGWWTGNNAIPEGTRFRFPSNITVNSAWSPLTKMMVAAVRDYGMVLRDKAGSTAFFLEDPSVYGKGEEVLTPYMNGKQIWDIVGVNGEFPWASLQALA